MLVNQEKAHNLKNLDNFLHDKSHIKKNSSTGCSRQCCRKNIMTLVQLRRFYQNRNFEGLEIHMENINCEQELCQVCEYTILHVCDKTIGIADLRDLTMSKNLIIYCKDISRFARQFCVSENIFILTFTMASLISIKNPIINLMYKLNKQEKKKLIQIYGSINNFPKLKREDTIVQLAGGKKKDLVCILRHGYEEVENHCYYRLII